MLLISDGFCAEASARQLLLDLCRHAAVSVLVVADALELALVPAGRYPLEHGGERQDVVLQSERQRRDFQRAIGAGPAQLGELAKSLGLRFSTIDTAADPLDAVVSVLGARRSV